MNPKPKDMEQLKREARSEVGDILVDFENDHDEVKAVKNIFEEIDKATFAERKRWQPVVNAWDNQGSVPSYHRQIKAKLRKEWLSLYKAILTAVEKDIKSEHVTLEQDIQATWLKYGLRVTKETVKGHTWIIEAERIED